MHTTSPKAPRAAAFSRIAVLAAALLLSVAVVLPATDADRTQANSYDNAWKTAWVTHLRNILTAQGGSHTSGFVIHIGDSITYANQYGMYQANYAGSNANDIAAITYSRANGTAVNKAFGSIQPNDKNGWNLAKEDLPRGGSGIGRSYTASSGITSGEWLAFGGSHGMCTGNNTVADPNPLDDLIANSSTAVNANGMEVAIISDAQVALVMLGTNDIGTGITTAAAKANLQSIITKLEAANIMVILSTIPPNTANNASAIALNTEITNLAQANNLPLIDFYAEILRRRPGTTWQGTLIQADGIHPSVPGFPVGTPAYTDPDTTPSVLDDCGQELRGFLSIAKLWEVKNYVIDGNPPPGGGPTITAQPTNKSVVAGASQTISMTATGTGTLTYVWTKVAAGVVGGNLNSITFSPAAMSDAGSYYVTVTDSIGSTVSNTVVLTVTVAAPTITSQPVATAVNQNQTATFTVAASGTGLTYAWKKQGSSTTIGTLTNLTLPNCQSSTAGNYYVVVSNGGGSVTSNVVALTVNLLPVITAQPAAISVVQPATATFSVTATGATGYQWQLNSIDIPSATSNSYTTGVTNTGMTGDQYRVKVTNGAGTVTSNQAVLTVTASAVAPSITTQPANQSVATGATATFSVVATGTAPLTYQWYKDSTLIGGATSSSYTTPATTAGDNGAVYTVTVTNSVTTVTSNNATLTVTGSGSSVTLNVTAIALGAPLGSTAPVNTTVTIHNGSAGTVTVTPSSSVTFVTTSGPVTIPAGSTLTVTITGYPSGLTGVNSGTVTFTNSTGGSTTVPVSFTVGVTTGQRKRSCSIGQTANPDMLMWVFGLVTLAGLTVAMRRQN